MGVHMKNNFYMIGKGRNDRDLCCNSFITVEAKIFEGLLAVSF
jgi:hypothetical protein